MDISLYLMKYGSGLQWPLIHVLVTQQWGFSVSYHLTDNTNSLQIQLLLEYTNIFITNIKINVFMWY
jgi:hypothetical protein